MGIFNSIKDKLFGKANSQQAAPSATGPAPSAKGTLSSAAGPAPANAQPTVVQEVKAGPVDVAAVLDSAVKAKGQKLDWRNSIVDLMKALDLDSSLAARKELAAELKYSGSAADGSAEKNIWLHKELMKALAQNGGKIPKELLA